MHNCICYSKLILWSYSFRKGFKCESYIRNLRKKRKASDWKWQFCDSISFIGNKSTKECIMRMSFVVLRLLLINRRNKTNSNPKSVFPATRETDSQRLQTLSLRFPTSVVLLTDSQRSGSHLREAKLSSLIYLSSTSFVNVILTSKKPQMSTGADSISTRAFCWFGC